MNIITPLKEKDSVVSALNEKCKEAVCDYKNVIHHLNIGLDSAKLSDWRETYTQLFQSGKDFQRLMTFITANPEILLNDDEMDDLINDVYGKFDSYITTCVDAILEELLYGKESKEEKESE